jgi:beta-glucanase (GH16 family)
MAVCRRPRVYRETRTLKARRVRLLAAVLITGLAAGCTPSAQPKSTPSPTVSAASALTENFDGAAGTSPNPAAFTLRVGGSGWGNRELETYTSRPVNASLDGDGHLVIQALRERFTGTDGTTRLWTSARMDTLGKWSFTTGTIAVRMKVPAGAGLWPAFWLIGANVVNVGWPRSGEIDVAETTGAAPIAFQTLHGPNSSGHPYQVSVKTRARTGAYAGAFHIFSVTRSPGSTSFAIDGHRTGRLTRANLTRGQQWVYDGPMVVVLNLAVGGNWPGAPRPTTPSPAQLVVDWITYHP